MTDLKVSHYPNIGQSFGIAGIMILMTILMTPLNLLLNNVLNKEASLFVYYSISVGASFWIVYLIRKNETGNRTFNLEIKNKRILPFIVVTTIALLFGIVTPISSLIPMPDVFKKAFSGLVQLNGFFSFLMMVIAAPILEELIFRGIMLDGLLKRYSPVKSILVSSFLFGLVHLNPWQFVTGFVIGIFAGWIYYQTRSLSLPILIHFTANSSGYLMRFFMDTGTTMDRTLAQSYGGTLNLALAITGAVLVIVISVYYLDREFKKDNENLEAEGALT